jgi:hypothetical protein
VSCTLCIINSGRISSESLNVHYFPPQTLISSLLQRLKLSSSSSTLRRRTCVATHHATHPLLGFFREGALSKIFFFGFFTEQSDDTKIRGLTHLSLRAERKGCLLSLFLKKKLCIEPIGGKPLCGQRFQELFVFLSNSFPLSLRFATAKASPPSFFFFF